jgi:hypothetical protein
MMLPRLAAGEVRLLLGAGPPAHADRFGRPICTDTRQQHSIKSVSACRRQRHGCTRKAAAKSARCATACDNTNLKAWCRNRNWMCRKMLCGAGTLMPMLLSSGLRCVAAWLSANMPSTAARSARCWAELPSWICTSSCGCALPIQHSRRATNCNACRTSEGLQVHQACRTIQMRGKHVTSSPTCASSCCASECGTSSWLASSKTIRQMACQTRRSWRLHAWVLTSVR